MKITELYNKLNNPIDDLSIIEKLINAYANSSKGSFYSQLVRTVHKEHNKGQYYREDADRFYAMLFNKWKNSIVAMTKEEFNELYKKGSYGKDFIKMRNYLKNIPDVSTMKEANEIFYGSKQDKELESALEKYSWRALGEGSGWVHVCSRYLTAKKDKYPKVEHRLYVNTESLDTYKMATYLIEKCDEHHLPYYFKLDEWGNRDDTIVIYSSTENLTKYIEILQEIKKEHPELVARTKEPPILAGKIDGWIGYGSEPDKTSDGKRQSFNSVRAKLLEYSIGKVTKQWIMDHRNLQVTYQGQKLNFQELIAMKSTEKLISELETRYLSYERDDKKAAQANGTTYNPKTVNDLLGYTLKDIKSPQFKQNVYNVLKNSFRNDLPKICNGSYKDMDEIEMNVRNGKKITFRGHYLEEVIQELSKNISKNDPSFIRAVQSEIKNNTKQYGIDSDRFCLDIKAREKIMAFAKQQQDASLNRPQPTITQKPQPQPTVVQRSQPKQTVVQQSQPKQTATQKPQPQPTITQRPQPQPTVTKQPQPQPTVSKQPVTTPNNYDILKQQIKGLGSINDILKNQDLVMAIIAYSSDNRYFQALIDLVNEGLDKKEVSAKDLEIFTSGKIAKSIINMDQTAKRYAGRDANQTEILEKLSYLSKIKDSKAFAASFTQPEILQAMSDKRNTNLTGWCYNTEIPVDGFATVISELLESGNVDAAKEYLSSMSNYSIKYSNAKNSSEFSFANDKTVEEAKEYTADDYHMTQEGFEELIADGFEPGTQDFNDAVILNGMGRIPEKEDSVNVNNYNNVKEKTNAFIENYFNETSHIAKLGKTIEILKDFDLVKSIIAYGNDSSYFEDFINTINDGLEKKEIWPEDLKVFYSGEVADAIVNMNRTAREYGNREQYPSEAWDKLSVLASIKDTNSFAASFTHPEIIQYMRNNGMAELTRWTRDTHLPPTTGFAAVVYEMIESGNIDGAKQYLDAISGDCKKYSQTVQMKNDRSHNITSHSDELEQMNSEAKQQNIENAENKKAM